jgi:hypothetical protein
MIACAGMRCRPSSTSTGEAKAAMTIFGEGKFRAIVHVGGPVEEVDHTEGQQTTRVYD